MNTTPAPPAPASGASTSVPALEAVATAPLACGASGISWTEDRAIAQTGRARRDRDKLTVGAMAFTNTRARGGRPASLYTYIGVFGLSGLDLVRIDRGADADYLLVDPIHRASVEMDRFPVPSPNGRWFATAATGPVGTPRDDGEGGVRIVERTETGMRTAAVFARADLADDPCRLTNVIWQGETRFSVRVMRPGARDPTPAVYELRDGRWRQVG